MSSVASMDSSGQETCKAVSYKPATASQTKGVMVYQTGKDENNDVNVDDEQQVTLFNNVAYESSVWP